MHRRTSLPHTHKMTDVESSRASSRCSSASCWTCQQCTYQHEPPTEHVFLVCAICSTPKEQTHDEDAGGVPRSVRQQDTHNRNRRRRQPWCSSMDTKQQQREAVRSTQSSLLNWRTKRTLDGTPCTSSLSSSSSSSSSSIVVKQLSPQVSTTEREPPPQSPPRPWKRQTKKQQHVEEIEEEPDQQQKTHSRKRRCLLDVLRPKPSSSFVPRIRYRYISSNALPTNVNDAISIGTATSTNSAPTNVWKELNDEEFTKQFDLSSCPITILRDVLPNRLANQLLQQLEEDSSNW